MPNEPCPPLTRMDQMATNFERCIQRISDDLSICRSFLRNHGDRSMCCSWPMSQVCRCEGRWSRRTPFIYFNLAHRLGPLELIRRQHGANTSEALMLMNKYEYGVAFALNEEDAQALATRLRVDMSIITFNANLLRGLISGTLIMRDSYRRRVLGKKDLGIREPTLNSKQMAIALEFFLQIDGRHILSSSLIRPSPSLLQWTPSAWRLAHSEGPDLVCSMKVCSVQRMVPKQDTECLHADNYSVHVAIQPMSGTRSLDGPLLISIPVRRISSSTATRLISIVQRWVSVEHQRNTVESWFPFRRAAHRISSMRWLAPAVVMITSIQPKRR